MPDVRAIARRSDVALAAALVAVAVVEQFARADNEHSLRAIAMILGAGATVLVRQIHPVAATCAAAAVIVAAPDVDGGLAPETLAILLPIVLSYSCGAHAPTREGLLATMALVVAIQIHVGFSEFPNAEIAIATLPPWWGGREVRRRRELVHRLTIRTRELQAEEEAFVRLSVQRERARIARDLHDIVSHHLAVMVIQAGAGRLAEQWQPDVAAQRLRAIREAGTEALAEADRLVTMLHPGSTATPRLASLLQRARATGARVTVTPPDPALPPDRETIAYRVVQEALTNAMKHARGAAVDIRVDLTDHELAITVHNDAGATTSAIEHTGSGAGLAGMRERVAALGGTLEAGREADNGFRVRARLPLDRT